MQDGGKDGYDYIIQVIQYLEDRHGIAFFITSTDFDTLYRWWEKRIPLRVIEESISGVVERWQRKKKKIRGFANFYYEVKKNFKAFMELNVGAETVEQEVGEYREIENFFENFPTELLELKPALTGVFENLKTGAPFQMDDIYDRLLELFGDGRDLQVKVELFKRNLAPELRTPGILGKYKLNYLRGKFHIPDFDAYRDDHEEK